MSGGLCEIDPVLEALRATRYPHDIVDCDPEFADTSAVCEHYGFAFDDVAPGEALAKVYA